VHDEAARVGQVRVRVRLTPAAEVEGLILLAAGLVLDDVHERRAARLGDMDEHELFPPAGRRRGLLLPRLCARRARDIGGRFGAADGHGDIVPVTPPTITLFDIARDARERAE